MLDCIKTPPIQPPGVYFSGRSDGCTEPWIACLDHKNAMMLWEYLEALQNWADDNWKRCGAQQ